MNSTITDQIDQIEKPTCSATMDQIRLCLAIFAPPESQAATSSASQCSMLRLRRGRSMLRSRVSIDMMALPAEMRSDQGLRATHCASVAHRCPTCQHQLTPLAKAGAQGYSRPHHGGNDPETSAP